MVRLLLSLSVVAAGDGFTRVGENDGVLIESRPVTGSAFAELRLTRKVQGSVEALCTWAFEPSRESDRDAHIQSRRVLSESEDERITYEQIAPPMVSQRDYVLRSRRTRPAAGACRIDFEVANEHAPPLRSGWVRIERMRGSFAFELQPDGQVKVTHVIHMDPGGQIAAWMAEGTRRDMSVAWMRRLGSK